MLSSPSTSLFDTLTERPPTPPRDISLAVRETLSFLDDSNEVERSLSGKSSLYGDVLQDHTPSSSQGTPASSNGTKKVGFLPWPTCHSAARPGLPSSPTASVRKCHVSRTHAHPLKSILKQSTPLPPLTPDEIESKLSYFSPQIPGSFAKMLQSVIHELASVRQDSRLDAYMALNGALRTYDGVPDAPAMIARIDLFTQFLARDMAWKSAGGVLDINIVTQALKLTAAILFDSKLCGALDDDFRALLVNQSILMMEQTDVPKAIIKGYMHILAHQRFPSTMTAVRAEKLVTALHTIEDRCSGNSVTAGRLVIYQRLLEQAPAVMLIRSRDWLEHAFHGMLSSIKDTRTRACEMCATAGFILGTQPQASKALRELFDSEVEDGQTYFDYLHLRMMQMITETDLGVHVPQMWAAVVLFFRNKRMPLEKWPKFKSWLLIIQKCLNSADLLTKYQANLAWNKLIFAVMPDASTSKIMFSMLTVPIFVGLEKRAADKQAKHHRQIALDSYYNLLHYGLRPGLTHEEIDSAWDTYVDPVLNKMVENGGQDSYTACRVLHGLFSPGSAVWNLNAATEHTVIKPEGLPRLDPRWVRARLAKVLRIIEPLLSSAMWSPGESHASLDATLYTLLAILAEAGTQEVKTSNELKDAVALLLNLLRRLWSNAAQPPPGVEPGMFVERYKSLVTMIIKGIGPSPFAENILVKNKEDGIEATPTPSNRSSKHHGSPHSPFVLLFGLLYQPPPGLGASPGLTALASEILRLQSATKPTPTTRIETLNRAMEIWSASYAIHAEADIAATLWGCVAECARAILESPAEPGDRRDSQSLGVELRNFQSILAHGLKHSPRDLSVLDAASELYESMFSVARNEIGPAGAVLSVVEPLAKLVADENTSDSHVANLHLAVSILRTAVWPQDQQEFDQSWKSLGGTTLSKRKTTSFDPFEHVYRMITDLFIRAHGHLCESSEQEMFKIPGIFEATLGFFRKCPLSLLAVAIQKIQDGLVVWIKDEDRSINKRDTICESVWSMWQGLLQLLTSVPVKDSALLKVLEPLLITGLSSTRKAIVDEMISFWNANFGHQQALEYPPLLEKVLRARLIYTNIDVPGLPESNSAEPLPSLPSFTESLIDAALGHDKLTTCEFTRPGSTSLNPAITSTNENAIPSSPARRHTRSSLRSTPRNRSRRDDSQIQFAQVKSSPIRFEDDSQHLTDHHEEVQERRHGNAQMFPEFSSSPLAQSTGLPTRVPKRLDFSSDHCGAIEKDEERTPIGLSDRDCPMSDDIPSSPTPSSARGSDYPHAVVSSTVDENEEGAFRRLPSSPMRERDAEGIAIEEQPVSQLEEKPVETIAADPVAADNESVGSTQASETIITPQKVQRQDTGLDRYDHESDLPSDSVLPTEQLQNEAQAVAEVEARDQRPVEREGVSDEAQAIMHQSDHSDMAREGSLTTVSFVENSFTELVNEDSASVASDPQSPNQRLSKKRKRSSETIYATKKRKPQSPFKRFFSSFLGQSQSQPEDDEDDMEDEIVVASSQPSAASAIDLATYQVASSPLQPNVEISDPTILEEETIVSTEPPLRRASSRLGNSEQGTNGQVESQPTPTLKRKASVLSDESTAESATATVLVKDTPAPPKLRKQREGQDLKLIRAAQQMLDSESGRTTRRSVLAVIPSPVQSNKRATSVDNEESTIEMEREDGEPVIEGDGSAVLEERFATPKSILGRLKEVLADLPKIILGSQEEREVDDVLFEIRKEMHEAARRGKT